MVDSTRKKGSPLNLGSLTSQFPMPVRRSAVGVNEMLQKFTHRERKGRASTKSSNYARLEEAVSTALGRVPILGQKESTDSLVQLVTAPFRRLHVGLVATRQEFPQKWREFKETAGKLDAVERLSQPIHHMLFIISPKDIQCRNSPSFRCPLDLYFVSSGYGYRGERHHNGVDLAAEEGTPIRAAAAGTVVFSGYEAGYGNFIEVEHEGGWRTLYAHTKTNCKKIGDPVKAKEVIGEVGSTGRSTGPHLHFEIRDPYNVPKNPALFMFFNKRRSLPAELDK